MQEPIFPSIKRSLENLIEDEEGNIPAGKLLTIGTMVVLLANILSIEGFAAHGSHSSQIVLMSPTLPLLTFDTIQITALIATMVLTEVTPPMVLTHLIPIRHLTPTQITVPQEITLLPRLLPPAAFLQSMYHLMSLALTSFLFRT